MPNQLLTSLQIMRAVLWGVALWFVGAILLLYLGPMGIYEGTARFWLYALLIPGTVPFILCTPWVVGITREKLALATSIVVASAILCDGVAVAWFPSLYGSEVTLVLGAAATILWGGGVAIALGFLFNKAGSH